MDKTYLLYLVKVDGFIVLPSVEYWAFGRVALSEGRERERIGMREIRSEDSREETGMDTGEKRQQYAAMEGDRWWSVSPLQGDQVGQEVPRTPWVQYFQGHQWGQESPFLLQHLVGLGGQEDLVPP